MTSHVAATVENLKPDLRERPIWPLSSFGPGKNPPCQLIDGKDVSPEEARVMAYLAQTEGNLAAYVRLPTWFGWARMEY
jgi:nucleoporin NUP42